MYERILVPVDGSPTANRGLREAIGLARDSKSTLVLLNVVDDYPMLVEMAAVASFEDLRKSILDAGEAVLTQAKAQAAESGVACEAVLREVNAARAADAIVQEAVQRHCNLIVMGTHGRRGLNRLAMGSDAELVIRQAPVPVLLVRQEEPKG